MLKIVLFVILHTYFILIKIVLVVWNTPHPTLVGCPPPGGNEESIQSDGRVMDLVHG